MRAVTVVCAALGALLSAVLPARADSVPGDSAVAPGERIYRNGLGTDGAPLAAVVQHDVPLSGPAAACVNCHRRSGLGSAEGETRAPPIVAPALFSPARSSIPRPAYDDVTLLRALSAGIAADGRQLAALMPRYDLKPQDAQALLSYLHWLGSAPPPGVDAARIELATVLTADAPPAQRQALEQVVARFVSIKNGGTRREESRAAAARRHPYGERRDRAFRTWSHRFWQLTGPAETWDEQLEHFYREQQPFAVLSAATGSQWMLDAFCERKRLPCILPLPSARRHAATGFYTLYFDDGTRRDAGITALHLQRTLRPSDRVLLVTNDDAVATDARRAFADRWHTASRTPPRVLLLRDGREGPSLLRQELAAFSPAALVVWLPAARLQSLRLDDLPAQQMPRSIYTAESFSPLPQTIAAHAGRTYHVYPYRLPQPAGLQFPREQAWLRSQGLLHLDTIAATHALVSCHVLGEALAGIESSFSRDYFMEQLEHMLDGTQMTSIYPVVGLGPGQRVLTHGAYVLHLTARGDVGDAQWLEGP